jgi:hypothetical protein
VSCTPQPQKTPDEIETFSKLTDKTVALMHKFSVGAPVVDVRMAIQDVLDAFAAAQPRIYAAVSRIAQSSGRLAVGDIDPSSSRWRSAMTRVSLLRTRRASIANLHAK